MQDPRANISFKSQRCYNVYNMRRLFEQLNVYLIRECSNALDEVDLDAISLPVEATDDYFGSVS